MPVPIMRHFQTSPLALVVVITIQLFCSNAFVDSFSKYAIHRNCNRFNPPFRKNCAFRQEGSQLLKSWHSFQLHVKRTNNPEEDETKAGANTSHDKIVPVATPNVVDDQSVVNQSSNPIEVNGSDEAQGSSEETIIKNISDNLQDNNSFITSALSFLHVLVDTFQELKTNLYAKIRQLWVDLVRLIQRSMKKTANWVQNDEMGQLISSALGLIAFFASVAAFAVWNIEVLGGKKFSGPAKVTVPVVQLPTSTTDGGSQSTTKFQKPKWKAPEIRTSYSTRPQEEESGK